MKTQHVSARIIKALSSKLRLGGRGNNLEAA
jgi:hypothetical protein